MTAYDRLFGCGPRGALMGTVLFVITYLLEDVFSLPMITGNDMVRYVVFMLFSIVSIFIFVWSLKSLPPKQREKKLVRTGAFKYFRHPLYAAFVSFFNFGFAVLMNNWIYMIWALMMVPVWHLNIRREELLMEKEFGQEYIEYCSKTGRFFIKIIN